MVTLDNAKVIARGRTAEVYTWNNGTILKRFYDWVSEDWIDREAHAAHILATSSIPCPKFYEAVTVSGRKGLVFERVSGPSMLKSMFSKPWLLSQRATLFANLQFTIHTQSGQKLPLLKGMIRDAISRAQKLEPEVRSFALELLGSLPQGDSLCHYDFHPDQIIMSPNGPKVIDWMIACQGDPMADVARTLVISSIGSIPDHINFFVRKLSYLARGSFHRKYLKEYLKLNPKADLQTIRRWMIPIAAARLSEEVPGDDLRIVDFLQRSLTLDSKTGCGNGVW